MSSREQAQWILEDVAFWGGKILKLLALVAVGGLLLAGVLMMATWKEQLWPVRARANEIYQVIWGKMLPRPCWDNRDLCDANGNLKPKPVAVTAKQLCADEPGLALHCQLYATADFFNERMFGGSLEPVVITLRQAPKASAYYRHRAFKLLNGKLISEIAMNQTVMRKRSLMQSASTILHEQCHMKVAYDGNATRVAHNKAWVECMLERGLQPSSTGRPGGRTTGKNMTHYIPKNSKFRAIAKQSPLLKSGRIALK